MLSQLSINEPWGIDGWAGSRLMAVDYITEQTSLEISFSETAVFGQRSYQCHSYSCADRKTFSYTPPPSTFLLPSPLPCSDWLRETVALWACSKPTDKKRKKGKRKYLRGKGLGYQKRSQQKAKLLVSWIRCFFLTRKEGEDEWSVCRLPGFVWRGSHV